MSMIQKLDQPKTDTVIRATILRHKEDGTMARFAYHVGTQVSTLKDILTISPEPIHMMERVMIGTHRAILMEA